jgi:fimbrial chaperone protein
MLRTWLKVTLAAVLGIVLFLRADGAWAASFEVSPIRLSISPASPSALLTVRNQSSEPQRFQVTAFAWKQGPGGEMVLDPTSDIVVFPTLFSLTPGDVRHLRVGSTAPIGAVERTYRIVVEELPPPTAPGVNGVRVLTRMNVPLFQSPTGSAPTPGIDGLAVQGGDVVFSVRNRGSAFFFARHVRVNGVSREGKVLFSHELSGWYVLAGGLRNYTHALPAEACDGVRLVVQVETEATTVEATLELPPRPCRR